MADLMDAKRCQALSRRSGEQCKRPPIPGGRVCHMHGGGSAKVRAAAQRRRDQAAADALLKLVWDPDAAPVTDPIQGLQRLSGRLERAVDVLGARLEDDGLDGAAAEAWVKVMGELRRALDGMARLGIAERHVELERARAELVTSAFRAALVVLSERVTLLPADRDLVLREFLDRLSGPGATGATAAGEVMA